jgi:hypothetical protein
MVFQMFRLNPNREGSRMSTLDAAVVSYLLSQQPEQVLALPAESAHPFIAPHEYVLVYCPQEPHALSRHALAQRLHDWFPEGNLISLFLSRGAVRPHLLSCTKTGI